MRKVSDSGRYSRRISAYFNNEIRITNVKCVRAQGASKRKRVLYLDFESSLLYHCPLGFFSDPVFFQRGGIKVKLG